jgi:hypothetical protein
MSSNYLEFRTMHKVRKPSYWVCYTQHRQDSLDSIYHCRLLRKKWHLTVLNVDSVSYVFGLQRKRLSWESGSFLLLSGIRLGSYELADLHVPTFTCDHPAFDSRKNSAGLRIGSQRGRISSPGRVMNFHFSMYSRPALWRTQSPIPWLSEQGVFPGSKAALVWS